MGVNAGDELPETEAGGHGFGQVEIHTDTKVLIALFGEPVLPTRSSFCALPPRSSAVFSGEPLNKQAKKGVIVFNQR
jgi:hypothetical protein